MMDDKGIIPFFFLGGYMKQKEYIQNLKKDSKKKKWNYSWIICITVLAFIISFAFSFLSEWIMPNVSVFIGILLIVFFILLGILFDMIGVSVTSADVAPFHSMSSKKIRGANVAVICKKNADKVSSFCNDVIGDVCGIISGSAGVYVASSLALSNHWNLLVTNLMVTSLIAAFTIGGKAIGKGIAINNNTMILYEFSKWISYFYQPK